MFAFMSIDSSLQQTYDSKMVNKQGNACTSSPSVTLSVSLKM